MTIASSSYQQSRDSHQDGDDLEEVAFDSLPTPLELSPAALLAEYSPNVLAPLVRHSKLPFRHLCSLYETHITHTPMILAEEFSRSQSARISDFSTSTAERGLFWMEPTRRSGSGSNGLNGSSSHPEDQNQTQNQNRDAELATTNDYKHASSSTSSTSSSRGRLPPSPTPPTPRSQLVRGRLIAQFASPNPTALADAAELISPYVDGIDLNCGCPQRWAYQEGIGCALLRKPEVVRDMIRAVQGRLGWGFNMSIKIRIDPDLKLTDQLVRTALSVGVSHITIHGRTRHQASSEPASLEWIRFAVESIKGEVPTVGNGDIWDIDDVHRMRTETGVNGVMAARGLLANPALFAGYKETPQHAVEQFTNLALDYGLIFPLFHKHLAYMLESRFAKGQRIYFNSMTSTIGAVNYLAERGLDIHSTRGTMWDSRRGRSGVVTLAA